MKIWISFRHLLTEKPQINFHSSNIRFLQLLGIFDLFRTPPPQPHVLNIHNLCIFTYFRTTEVEMDLGSKEAKNCIWTFAPPPSGFTPKFRPHKFLPHICLGHFSPGYFAPGSSSTNFATEEKSFQSCMNIKWLC